MEKLPPLIHTLDTFDAARGELTLQDGSKQPMIRFILKVDRHDLQGRHPTETWPDLWLEPHTAVAFAQAIHTALLRHLPAEAARLGIETPAGAPPGQALS